MRLRRVVARSCLLITLALAASQSRADEPAIAAVGDPFRAVQAALLADDHDEARRLLRAIPSPSPGSTDARDVLARAALLEAAMAPLPRRSRALLEVAWAFPDRGEGLTALVSSLHWLESQLGKRFGIEEEEQFSDEGAPMGQEAALATEQIFHDCVQLQDRWHSRVPDDPRVRLAADLIEACRFDLVVEGPARLAAPLFLLATESIPVPSPLAERVQVRFHKMGPALEPLLFHTDRSDGSAGLELLAPFMVGNEAEQPMAQEELLPGRTDLSVTAPPPGFYLLEVRSPARERSRFQLLVISDLHLLAWSATDGFALLATDRGRPAAGVEIFAQLPGSDQPMGLVGRTDERGVLSVPHAKEGERTAKNYLARYRPLGGRGEHLRPIKLDRWGSFRGRAPELTAHLFVDRSIYRPGESILGRILVRRHDQAEPLEGLHGNGADVTPAASPLAGRDIVVEFELPGEETHSFELETDGFGVATFELPLSHSVAPGGVDVTAWIPVDDPDEFRVRSHWRYDCDERLTLDTWCGIADIQFYRRPPLLLDIEWPDGPLSRDTVPEVRIDARYPSGAPAAGLAGEFLARLGRVEQAVPYVLDRLGAATVRLAFDELAMPSDTTSINCSATVRAADGQDVTEQRVLELQPAIGSASSETARSGSSPEHASLHISPLPVSWLAGEDLTVELTGPAGAPVLLSIGRTSLLHAGVVLLDDSGSATTILPTREEWWPGVWVSAALPDRSTRPGFRYRGNRTWYWRWLRLDRADHHLRVSLEKGKDRFAPGEEVCWTVVTRGADGQPTPSTVALSVVDERLALLMDDRLKQPGQSLTPYWNRYQPHLEEVERPTAIEHLFDSMIEDGLVTSPFFVKSAAGPGTGGPATPGGSRAARPRVDFRPAAFFRGDLVTGPDGRGTVRFTFPDDLTTWRVVLIAVDRGCASAVLEERVRTALDLSITPLLPRIVREGDRVRVHSVVHADEGPVPADAHTDLGATGSLEMQDDAMLVGKTAGPGVFSASLRDRDSLLDEVRLEIPVHARQVPRATWTAAAVIGSAQLSVPAVDGGAPDRLRLELLGGIASLIDRTRGYLERYPYGCAEQTASCLTPLVLARSPLDPVQAHRLEQGLARLRSYQRSDGGFAWWGTGPTSREISACVLRFLALMRDAGMRPEDSGIVLDPQNALFVAARDRVRSVCEDGASFSLGLFEQADLLAHHLTLFPRDAESLETCRRLAASAAELPAGLLARLGRALARAGDDEAATSILFAVRSRHGGNTLFTTRTHGNLNEHPSTQLADTLSFVLCVAPDDPLVGELLASLIARFDAGRFTHTASSAAALAALTRYTAAAPTAPKSIHVAVFAEGLHREFDLGPGNEWRAECDCPPEVGPITVSTPAGSTVVALLRADRLVDGATAPALARPIEVTRRLLRMLPDNTGRMVLREPVGEIQVGDTLEAEIVVKAPATGRYLVVDCPLPAGIEAVRTSDNEVLKDDRVVFCSSAFVDFTWRLRLHVAMEGRVAWPPVLVEAMYDHRIRGWSAGSWLTVGPAGPRQKPREPARVLTSDQFEARFAANESMLQTRTDMRGVAALLRAQAALPVADRLEWFFHQAPAQLSWRLQSRTVARAYVEGLGHRVAERFSGTNLEALLDLEGINRQQALVSFARALARSGFGEQARARIESGQPLGVAEADLLVLVCLRDRHRNRAGLERIAGDATRLLLRQWDQLDRETRLSQAKLLAQLLVDVWPEEHSERQGLWQSVRRRAGTTLLAGLTQEAVADEVKRYHLLDLLPIALDGREDEDAASLTEEVATRMLALRPAFPSEAEFCDGATTFLSIAPCPVRNEFACQVFYAMFGFEGDLGYEFEIVWDSLTEDARNSVPARMLVMLVLEYSAEFAMEELLRRGGHDRKTLLDTIARIEDEDLLQTLRLEMSRSDIEALPGPALLKLTKGLEHWWEDDEADRDLMREVLSDADFSTEELASLLATSRDPDARFLLVQVLADRGCGTVPFAEGDPAADYYRNLLLARLGDPEAVAAVRDSVATLPEDSEEDVFFDLFWSLVPHLSVEQLVEIVKLDWTSSLPEVLVRPITERADDEQLLRILQDQEMNEWDPEVVLESVPVATWERLVPRILDLERDRRLVHVSDRMFEAIGFSADATELLRERRGELWPDFVKRFLDWAKYSRPCDLGLIVDLKQDRGKAHLLRAAGVLSRYIGNPATWLPPTRPTYRGDIDALFDVAALLGRFESSALEELEATLADGDSGACARIFLARHGLDLSSPSGD